MSAIFLAVVLSLRPGTDLRLFNPHATPAEAHVCGAAVQLSPGQIVDLAGCSDAALDASSPLVVLETMDEEQRLIAGIDARCGSTAMRVPLFACKRANANASVPLIEGATYAWSSEGASIVDGAGTNQIVVTVGDLDTAKLTCVITTSDCSSTATGIIAVRAPLVIRELVASSNAETAKPVTIDWSYEPGAEPASQMLSGDAFAEPVTVAAAARSYTFTPDSGGTKHVELRASYARAIPTTTKSRRRAAGSTLDAIAICPSARANVQFEVRGCAFRPKINAPDDVLADSTFPASVTLADGDVAEWSVQNGTINGTNDRGDRANIRAGGTGVVIITLRVTSSACSASAEARVPTYQKQCATPPVASVELLSRDCDRATVRATFTGAPPFAGMWSDRTTFRTDAASTVHSFDEPGLLRVAELHDANCNGAASNSVSVPTLQPTVTLENNGSCGTGQLVARFNGVPPFSGTWSDGAKFTTSESQITRTVAAGTWSVIALTDANCRTRPASSKSVTVAPQPSLIVPMEPSCVLGGGGRLNVDFEGGQPPYVVQWTDGVIAKSVTGPRVQRNIPFAQGDFMLQVKSAASGSCTATIPNTVTRVIYRAPFEITTASDDNYFCIGEPVPFRITNPVPVNATFNWTITGAKVTTGQGTDQVTILPTSFQQWTPLTATAKYADGYCDVYADRDVNFWERGGITSLRLSPTTVKAGAVATLSFRKERIISATMRTLTPVAYVTKVDCDFNDDACSALVVTSVPGIVPVEVSYTDCAGVQTQTINLTVQ